MRRCIGGVAITGAVLSTAALALSGVWAAFSVAVGAGLAAGNLWVLARVIASILPRDRKSAERQGRAGWVLVGMVKMVGVVAVVWLLMRHGVVSPLAMVVGLCSLPIGIAIGSLVSDRAASDED
jgi:hypothetical protein